LLCGSIEGKPPWTRPVTPIFRLVFTRRLKGNIQKYQTQSKLLYKVLSYISPRTKGVPRRPDKGGGVKIPAIPLVNILSIYSKTGPCETNKQPRKIF